MFERFDHWLAVFIPNPIIDVLNKHIKLYIHAPAPLGCSIEDAEKFRDDLTKAIDFAKQKEGDL